MALMCIATANGQTSNDIIAPIDIEWPQVQIDRQLGYADGKARAESNIRHGDYLYLAVSRDSWKPEDHYLNQKYGISPSFSTPTNKSEYILAWIKGYNDRVMVLYAEKFGTNVFQEAEQAVQKGREEKAQPPPAPRTRSPKRQSEP
jgi:hypothetical protein